MGKSMRAVRINNTKEATMRNKKLDDFLSKIQLTLLRVGLFKIGNRLQDFRVNHTIVKS